jgi:hypothetical protein
MVGVPYGFNNLDGHFSNCSVMKISVARANLPFVASWPSTPRRTSTLRSTFKLSLTSSRISTRTTKTRALSKCVKFFSKRTLLPLGPPSSSRLEKVVKMCGDCLYSLAFFPFPHDQARRGSTDCPDLSLFRLAASRTNTELFSFFWRFGTSDSLLPVVVVAAETRMATHRLISFVAMHVYRLKQ